LTCDPLLIDVNIHPQKKEIKLSEEARLKTVITEGLADALKKTARAARLQTPPQKTPEFMRFDALHEAEPLHLQEDGIQTSNRPFPILEYVGQVHGTYLVMQGSEGLFLIDQHAAAERIRYEAYVHHMAQDTGLKTELLTPLEIPLSVLETREIAPHLDTFKAFNLSVELTDHALLVHAVPHYFHPGKEYDYALEMIEHLVDEKSLTREVLIDQMAKDLSCKHSIKGNTKISREEVDVLVRDLAACQNPFQCPHGRPTVIEFTQASLENMFGRTMA